MFMLRHDMVQELYEVALFGSLNPTKVVKSESYVFDTNVGKVEVADRNDIIIFGKKFKMFDRAKKYMRDKVAEAV